MLYHHHLSHHWKSKNKLPTRKRSLSLAWHSRLFIISVQLLPASSPGVPHLRAPPAKPFHSTCIHSFTRYVQNAHFEPSMRHTVGEQTSLFLVGEQTGPRWARVFSGLNQSGGQGRKSMKRNLYEDKLWTSGSHDRLVQAFRSFPSPNKVNQKKSCFKGQVNNKF